MSRIAADMPELTVHDISHLDALWDTASLVAEGAIDVNPAEAFVLGASILLHDAGMSLAAYPGGMCELMTTTAWKDAIARVAMADQERDGKKFNEADPPDEIIRRILPEVLRKLHAQQAEVLVDQAWQTKDGEDVYLIEDSDLRTFYGRTIGRIAHSHWWSVQEVENELSGDLGPLATHTNNSVDRVKIACLLRVADVLHMDNRRAPRFLHAITSPSGVSSLHWTFQERLAAPQIESDAVVFTTGQPFKRTDAEAWWLAYDLLNVADQELRDVDLLLHSRGREVLRARKIKGIGSPEMLSRTVETQGWRPIDTRPHISDIQRIIENLGGRNLYGNDPRIALRELIQNAADAVEARRRIQKRPLDWGQIIVKLIEREEGSWLIVEDNGIGMSEAVLTGPLIDFGKSFWRSNLATEEFPGLLASGMRAIGRFGIGFFSAFILGRVVRVYSRRFDKGIDTGRLMEFHDGTATRPILSEVNCDEFLLDGGTRVEVLLTDDPLGPNGLLVVGSYKKVSMSLSALIAAVAPNLNVGLSTIDGGNLLAITQPDDWLEMPASELRIRLNPMPEHQETDSAEVDGKLMQEIIGKDGTVYGRARIYPSRYYFADFCNGWVTISGLRASEAHNIQGILLGEPTTVARDAARPLVCKQALARWASRQAQLVADLVLDDEIQAKTAEIVLECGGDIGSLKVIRFGESWLNIEEFDQRLESSSELVVWFEGEIEYEEDQDKVHPNDFRMNFDQSEDVAIALKYNGSILSLGNSTWPRVLTENKKPNPSNVADFIRNRIYNKWGTEIDEYEEERPVGIVAFTEITRKTTIFCPALD